MTSKQVTIYVELWPGWQDCPNPSLGFTTNPFLEKLPGWRRVKIMVELPCFGGSAETDQTVRALAIEEKGGD